MEHPLLGLAAYGAATTDLDGDGLLDIFTTGADRNRLYLATMDGEVGQRMPCTVQIALLSSKRIRSMGVIAIQGC